MRHCSSFHCHALTTSYSFASISGSKSFSLHVAQFLQLFRILRNICGCSVSQSRPKRSPAAAAHFVLRDQNRSRASSLFTALNCLKLLSSRASAVGFDSAFPQAARENSNLSHAIGRNFFHQRALRTPINRSVPHPQKNAAKMAVFVGPTNTLTFEPSAFFLLRTGAQFLILLISSCQ